MNNWDHHLSAILQNIMLSEDKSIMTGLLISVALFFGLHMIAAFPKMRGFFIRHLGKGVYFSLFSLLALVSLTAGVYYYRHAPFILLWKTPLWAYWIPAILMPFAFILLVSTYMSPKISNITRHPMLWSVILWSLPHLSVNGDLASVIVFGGFLAFAIVDQPLNDAKLRQISPEKWVKLSGSSCIPFYAILKNKTPLRFNSIGIWPFSIGITFYLLAIYLHPYVIGVSALP